MHTLPVYTTPAISPKPVFRGYYNKHNQNDPFGLFEQRMSIRTYPPDLGNLGKEQDHTISDVSSGKLLTGGLAGYFGARLANTAMMKPIREIIGKNIFVADPMSYKTATKLVPEMIRDNNLTKKLTIEFFDQNTTEAIKSKANTIYKHLDDSIIGRLKNSAKTPVFIKNFVNNLQKFISASTAAEPFACLVNGKYAFGNKTNPSYIFHEIGHSAVIHSNKWGKALAKSSILLPIALTPLFITALFHKNTDHKEGASPLQKTKAFIHDNMGKITLAAFSPMLINEFLASHKAIQFLKKAKEITPEQLKFIKGKYAIAYSSYIGLTLASLAAIKLGIYIKDKLTGIKQPQKGT
jgi:hypothetical protein